MILCYVTCVLCGIVDGWKLELWKLAVGTKENDLISKIVEINE